MAKRDTIQRGNEGAALGRKRGTARHLPIASPRAVPKPARRLLDIPLRHRAGITASLLAASESPLSGTRAGCVMSGERDNSREARREAYVVEISARLRHVCQHLSDEEFKRLVMDMAETRLRFSAIDSGALARRPSSSPVRDASSSESGDAAP